jgi:hypothetical protein
VERRWPDEGTLHFVEWHARLIPDPVCRLRYLRQALQSDSAVRTRPRRARAWKRVAVLIGSLLALPAPPSADMETLPVRRDFARPTPPATMLPLVWLVERNEDFELYSNGLRVENLFSVSGKPRGYWLIPSPTAGLRQLRWATEPAGIVFHSTESHLAEFEPERTSAMRRAGLSLLEYVRRHRSYHFLVDPFGRVHRIVPESHVAHHAGWSAWCDENWLYLGLNDSFLGVAFETRTENGVAPLTPAQMHAGRVLTEMLRARFRIPPENCVTHAQVSLNPRNRRIGYHTDWATGFPFGELGLPDNYTRPPAAVVLFGFEYDQLLRERKQPGLWRGLEAAGQILLQEAAARGMTLRQYRAVLSRRYRETLAALERGAKENQP